MEETMAGTYVGPHAAPVANPAGVAEVEAAHAAGESVAQARRDHYHQNVLGQGAQAGDPMPAESTLQSFVPDSPNEGRSTL
jgi:ribose 5-phosphate isomerase RpiB